MGSLIPGSMASGRVKARINFWLAGEVSPSVHWVDEAGQSPAVVYVPRAAARSRGRRLAVWLCWSAGIQSGRAWDRCSQRWASMVTRKGPAALAAGRCICSVCLL